MVQDGSQSKKCCVTRKTVAANLIQQMVRLACFSEEQFAVFAAPARTLVSYCVFEAGTLDVYVVTVGTLQLIMNAYLLRGVEYAWLSIM